MIVSFNFYYARAGLEDAVLQQRLRACEVRERLGIVRGRVLERTAAAADLPDVIWEQRFDDVSGHHADMAVRAASAEFEGVRAGMRKLCRRFERPLFEICGNDAAPVRDSTLPGGAVTLDWIFCTPQQTAALLSLLQAHLAGDAAGHAGAGRLLRLITPGDDLPELVWQREQDARAAAMPGAASALPSEAAALAHRVEHTAWRLV